MELNNETKEADQPANLAGAKVASILESPDSRLTPVGILRPDPLCRYARLSASGRLTFSFLLLRCWCYSVRVLT